jgi:hypothetical protein
MARAVLGQPQQLRADAAAPEVGIYIAVKLDRYALTGEMRLLVADDLPVRRQRHPGVGLQGEVVAPALAQAVEREIGRPTFGDATGVDQVDDCRRVVEGGWTDQDAI